MSHKILFYLPQIVGGGAEKVTLNIINLLDRRNFDIHLVINTNSERSKIKLPENIGLHVMGVSKTVFSPIKLRRLIKRLRPDIFYSSLYRGHIAITLSMMFFKNKPLIILRSPSSPISMSKYKKSNFLFLMLIKYSYLNSDLIIAQTPQMLEELVEAFQIKRRLIKVFVNPLDHIRIEKLVKESANPFDPININIVAAGRLIYEKGFDTLINSFSKVVAENNSFRLHILGEDVVNDKEILEKQVNDLGLEACVFFYGYVENPYPYYLFSDVFVLSSRWEGLPNTVLESLYLKTPIVATNCIPFMNILIDEGNTGYIVPIDDVDLMAHAILNHHKLNLDFNNSICDRDRLNSFFLKIAINEHN